VHRRFGGVRGGRLRKRNEGNDQDPRGPEKETDESSMCISCNLTKPTCSDSSDAGCIPTFKAHSLRIRLLSVHVRCLTSVIAALRFRLPR